MCGPPSPLLVVFGCGSPHFCLAMHPRGGREGRLPLPRPAGPKQEYQMDPQREKAMRSIFGEAEVPDKTRSFKPLLCFFRVLSLILASIFIFEIFFFFSSVSLYFPSLIYFLFFCVSLFSKSYILFLPLYTCILCVALVSIQWPTLRLRPQRNS